MNGFHRAAVALKNRFYRRFPSAAPERYDLTTIKSRWYARGTCHIVRQRLGGNT